MKRAVRKIVTPKIITLAVLAALLGCGAATQETKPAAPEKKPDEAAEARQVVNDALKALRERDEAGFKAQLSSARAADYTASWYEMWTSEVGQFGSSYASGWEKDKDGVSGKVMVVVSGSHREQVPVRVRLEEGRWRWDEK